MANSNSPTIKQGYSMIPLSNLGVPLKRRTERACDQCRRRKSRCNGEADCSTCVSLGLRCTYKDVNKHSKGPKYIDELEKELDGLRDKLRRGAKGSAAQICPPPSGVRRCQDHRFPDVLAVFGSDRTDPLGLNKTIWTSLGTSLDSGVVIERIPCPDDIDWARKSSEKYFRGDASLIEVARSMRDLCDKLVGMPPKHLTSGCGLAKALDQHFPTRLSTLSVIGEIMLPSSGKLQKWTRIAFSRVFSLWPFVDQHMFEHDLNRILIRQSFDDRDGQDRLSLVYAVIALGQRFDPDLIDAEPDNFDTGSIRGLRYFGAAQTLIEMPNCAQSISAVQSILCLSLFLNSVAARRMAHRYVGTACSIAHQLGLHEVAHQLTLSERERVLRRQIYAVAQSFDAYFMSSLGMPCCTPALVRSVELADGGIRPESVQLLEANLGLFKTMRAALDSCHLSQVGVQKPAISCVSLHSLQEVDSILIAWGAQYHHIAHLNLGTLETFSRLQLQSQFSKCFVLLTIYSPFVHHLTVPDSKDSIAQICALRGLDAAVQTVRSAEELSARGLLSEAGLFTVEALVLATLSLLTVRLGTPEHKRDEDITFGCQTAKALLERLAPRNTIVAQCINVLQPLYQALASDDPKTTGLQEFPVFEIGVTQSSPLRLNVVSPEQ